MSADSYAAIDLGSNSFHLIVARLVDGRLRTIDSLKEMVQLGAGLDEKRNISDEAIERALDCLARFGQRLRAIPGAQVRVVGTNTLRQARNGRSFIKRAQSLLGHRIEVISGVEEARLIYLGVAQTNANVDGRRLVIDIGGGSTELVIGEDFETVELESLYLGCVSMTRNRFSDGTITAKSFERALLDVAQELEPFERRYRKLGWEQAIGASGTVKSIRDVVVASGWCNEGITFDAMKQLRALILENGKLPEKFDLPAERARVFVGGFAALYGLFVGLRLEKLDVSAGALREGVIYDLLGRVRHEDVRDRAIKILCGRYGVDEAQGGRAKTTASELFVQVRETWNLDETEDNYYLEKAAELHEIGLAIAHNQFHKHGGYIVEHSDVRGFSRDEQRMIAILVRGHRRKFPLKVFDNLPGSQLSRAKKLCVLLRLSVLLRRGRGDDSIPTPVIRVAKKLIELEFATGWLDDHPLTRLDLETEAAYLSAAGYKLGFC